MLWQSFLKDNNYWLTENLDLMVAQDEKMKITEITCCNKEGGIQSLRENNDSLSLKRLRVHVLTRVWELVERP